MLIADLMNNWSFKKRVFVLANGEIINVPLDMALITGLHITGKAVRLREDNIFMDLERHYIFNTENRKIKLSSLKKSLDHLGCEGDESKFLSLFTLYICYCFLFKYKLICR